MKDKIRDEVDKTKDVKDQIIWGEDYSNGRSIPHKNGYKHQIVVNFFGPEVGKELTVRVCRSIAEEYRDGVISKVSVNLVDEKLRKLFSNLPDPDLALYFGRFCGTYGLSPWHLRLTEFFSMEVGDRDVFLRALYRFAKCEQRFGK